MASKAFVPCVFVLVFLCAGYVSAQMGPEAAGGGYYYIEQVDNTVRIIQRLAWEKDANALNYEIIVEQKNPSGAGYTEVLRSAATEPFAEVSLAPGAYRYKVLVYDLLGRPAADPQWTPLDIDPAWEPVLSGFSPAVFYLDEDTVWELSLDGANLQKGAQIFLRFQDTGTLLKPVSVSIDDDGESALLIFDGDELVQGLFTAHVINPGGIETSLGTFRIAFRKPFDVNVSIGYAPLVPLYGYLFDTFDDAVFPVSAYARLGFIPFKRAWGYLGLELEPSWTSISKSASSYETFARIGGLHLNFLFQKWLAGRRAVFNIRAGAGVSAVYDFYFEHKTGLTSETRNSWFTSVSVGFSFQWFVAASLYVEAGAQFTQFITRVSPPPGFLRPEAGLGWRF
jgi:hypothetical protein